MAHPWEEAVAGRCIRRAATVSSKQRRTEKPSRACRGPRKLLSFFFFFLELIKALLKFCGVLFGETHVRR
jgi:hypothetical protein